MNDRKRSRSYPGVDLQASIENLTQIVQELGMGANSRLGLSKALGSEGITGSTARKIASMGAFGMLDKVGGAYQVSALGKKILRPLPGEEQVLLAQAFEHVTLYREILDAFASDGRLPKSLGTILERNHGIVPPNGDAAAKTLLESGQRAGIIDLDNNILLANHDIEPKEGKGIDEEVKSEQGVDAALNAPLVRADAAPQKNIGPAFRFELPVGEEKILVIIPDAASAAQISLLLELVTALKGTRK